jgi:hypothetical protein
MLLKPTTLALACLALFVFPASSFAGFAGSYAGALLGASIATESRGTNPIYAAHIGTDVFPQLSLGLYLSYVALGPDPTTNPVGNPGAAGVNEIIYALEPEYFPFRDYGVYVGAKLGVGVTTNRLVGNLIVGGSSVKPALGPALGFTLQIFPHLWVGEELNLIVVESSDSLLLFNILGRVDYRF